MLLPNLRVRRCPRPSLCRACQSSTELDATAGGRISRTWIQFTATRSTWIMLSQLTPSRSLADRCVLLLLTSEQLVCVYACMRACVSVCVCGRVDTAWPWVTVGAMRGTAHLLVDRSGYRYSGLNDYICDSAPHGNGQSACLALYGRI